MSDRTEWILELSVLSFVLLVGLVIGAILHWRKLHHVDQKIANMPGAMESTQAILDSVEGARIHIDSTGDELRGQHSKILARIQWCIGRIDGLSDSIKDFLKAGKPS